jgi:hypothetical protein
VRRRSHLEHPCFAAYWRDVHGPLCSRLPGLGWYVQHHFSREHDAHLWPLPDGVVAMPEHVLDGMVEIGFASKADQETFKAASPLLFSDEQNIFDETVAYDLPQGSRTYVDRLPNPTPNASESLDRLHVHFHSETRDTAAFHASMGEFASQLAEDSEVLKLRLHCPVPHDNATENPPAPNVEHAVEPARVSLAMLEVVFHDPLARRQFLDSKHFQKTLPEQSRYVSKLRAFRVSGVYTYVRDGELTTAGLRGSRAAELIHELAATNQVAPEVARLMQTGSL